MINTKDINGRSYVYNFHFHLIWVTKYRKAIFTDNNLVNDMKSMLLTVAKENDIQIEEQEVMNDHVHLLISFKPKYSATQVVKKLKGGTARMWFKEHPDTKNLLYGGHLWSNSYHMSTLGNMSQAVVERYIKNQRTTKSTAGRPKMK